MQKQLQKKQSKTSTTQHPTITIWNTAIGNKRENSKHTKYKNIAESVRLKIGYAVPKGSQKQNQSERNPRTFSFKLQRIWHRTSKTRKWNKVLKFTLENEIKF